MAHLDEDKLFTGSIPRLYDTCLVPLIFEPYAQDLAARLRSRRPSRVLEVAAGTGAATRAMDRALPEAVAIVASDLNQAMLDHAASVGTKRTVDWRQADANQLPFGDQCFDAVVCQFGAMFLTDKPHAFAEARRVLKPSGVFIFSVWDEIAENEFADVITAALADLFPQDPPRFLARTPHGYHDRQVIKRDLAKAGFSATPAFDTVAARSRAISPDLPAIAYCQGTPLRNEIEARDALSLHKATKVAAAAIAKRFGPGEVDGKIQAHVITVLK